MRLFPLPIASIWMVKIKIMEIVLALVLGIRYHIISIFISQVLIIVLNPFSMQPSN